MYSHKVNLKLKREKLASSPANQSPRGERPTISPRNSMTTNVENYFLNLRKQSNNTELQSPERKTLQQSNNNFYSSP